MRIKISPDAGTAIYLQIVRQVQYLVGTGRLKPGDELPSIRSLAQQLVINPNTVARAYRELESTGVVCKRGTSGTFVADQGNAVSDRQRRESLLKQVETLLTNAHQMGFTTSAVIKVVRDCDARIVSK